MNLIGRRDFVRGLGLGAGATLLTPFARSLIRQAQGQENVSQPRWILLKTSNGLGQKSTERWVPRSSDLTAQDALPPSFSPLAPWASKTLIIDYLYNPFNQGQHGNYWATLSVRGDRTQAGGGVQSWNKWPNPTGITVDVHAAKTVSKGAPFNLVAVGTDTNGTSSDENRNPISYYRDAREAYEQIFGSFDPSSQGTSQEAAERLKRRISVLDFAHQDLKRLRNRLSASEREKLDQMESSITEMEQRLQRLRDSQLSCELPSKPTVGGIGGHGAALEPEYLDAMVSIQLAALMCRLTNVIVLRPIPSRRSWEKVLGFSKDYSGESGFYAHSMAHGDDTETLVKVDQYCASLAARMISTLEKVPEGSGTMADRTLLTWYDKGGGRHHAPGGEQNTHPMIFVGDMQGHFKGGRHVRFPVGKHCVSDAFVSILQSLGMNDDSFGDPDECKGPLPGLT